MGLVFNTAQNAARDGILSSREVGKLISKSLEDGTVHRGEIADLKKIQTELYDELTPDARRAIRNFLSLGSAFDPGLGSEIFGVTDDVRDKLEKQQIRTSKDLLIATRTHDDRSQLAGQAGIDQVVLTSLAEQADLARTVGIGPKYAALLQRIGINDVQELAQQNAVALRRQITSFLKTGDGKKVASRRPSLKSVKKWIAGAKELPRMMRQMGDKGADFDKVHFDGLKPHQQHMLLMGIDVRLPSGFVFDDAQLAITQVRRKPRSLGDTVRSIENSAFSGDYESAELTNMERIKVGDEIIGYRGTFDVTTHDSIDGELGAGWYTASEMGSMGLDHEGNGDLRMRGTVDVTFDAEGNQISREDYIDYDYNHE